MAALLSTIHTPDDLRRLAPSELPALSAEVREYIISQCSENPGHLGASLGVVELTVALHYVFNTPDDKLIWDVGHQAYAHKILTGRREAFPTNRCYGGLSGFPKRSESDYDPFGGGHASVSVSAALGMAEAAKLQGLAQQTIAIIGDGALTGGLAYEGLNNAGASKANVLVVLNDNNISIDRNVGAIHNYLVKMTTSARYNRMKRRVWDFFGNNRVRRAVQSFVNTTKIALLRRSNLFEALGFRYFGPIDGHDLTQLAKTLQALKHIDGPKVLHVITTKGKGYKPAEENQTEWHAPGKYDRTTGERVAQSGLSRYQDVFGETIIELARQNSRIVGITPAMPTGCSLNLMMEEMPERTFDVGIAEEHAVTFSAGLAAAGMVPFCNIYSSFMQRAYDQVIHDVALQNLQVVFCLDRGGLVGEDGATHHGAYDMAAFRCIPNVIIAAPMNEAELRNMLYTAQLPGRGPTLIRYPRGRGAGLAWRQQKFVPVAVGKARLLHEGVEVAVLSIGDTGHQAAAAVGRLAADGVHVTHYDMRFLKPLDEDVLDTVGRRFPTVVTVENGAVTGGLGGAVAEFFTTHRYPVKVVRLGIPDRFIEQGSIAQLQTECGFDEESIYKEIKGMFPAAGRRVGG
ncbi:MAG: 1-deoxy-D-xylulose-5-phosphate synthase [Prevotellaceae bacterium]|jgi:1-deoxy-D-xylulose-5-phosphate synthase|nr:1-deoxy-D-xylulose-5-phosphate synthase [Prevotellaceae bacterium]